MILNGLFLYIVLLSTIKWYNLQPSLNSLQKITLLTLERTLWSSVRPKGNLLPGGCASRFVIVLRVSTMLTLSFISGPAQLSGIICRFTVLSLYLQSVLFLETQIAFLYSCPSVSCSEMVGRCGKGILVVLMALWHRQTPLPWASISLLVKWRTWIWWFIRSFLSVERSIK